jgi:hypothetical protein
VQDDVFNAERDFTRLQDVKDMLGVGKTAGDTTDKR